MVRHVYQAGRRFALSLFKTDDERAKRDPREGSVAGKLELLGTQNGGINRFDRMAGERFAEIVTDWRRKIAASPNPNAPAANLEGGTGRMPSGDPFDISDAEQDHISSARLRYEDIKKVIRYEGMANPPIEVMLRGARVWNALEAIFILNDETVFDAKKERVVRDDVVHLALRGLKPLIFHFGLTSEEDAL